MNDKNNECTEHGGEFEKKKTFWFKKVDAHHGPL